MAKSKKIFPKVKDQVVAIPEWSLIVSIVKLNKEQVAAYLEFIKRGCYDNKSQYDCDLVLTAFAAVDQGGNRVFNDIEILHKRSGDIVDRLYKAAIEKNDKIRYIKKVAKVKPVSKPKQEREQNDGKSKEDSGSDTITSSISDTDSNEVSK